MLSSRIPPLPLRWYYIQIETYATKGKPLYITTRKQLEQFIDRARVSEVLAVDTESSARKHTGPKLCLIQMGTERESVAIDPFAFDSLRPSKSFSRTKNREAVPAASQDLEIIHHELGVLPEPIFDTQNRRVAARRHAAGWLRSARYERVWRKTEESRFVHRLESAVRSLIRKSNMRSTTSCTCPRCIAP